MHATLVMYMDALSVHYKDHVRIARVLLTFFRKFYGTLINSTLLLLVPFSYKLMHHLKPFAIVVLNGEITVYSVDSPNGFEW